MKMKRIILAVLTALVMVGCMGETGYGSFPYIQLESDHYTIPNTAGKISIYVYTNRIPKVTLTDREGMISSYKFLNDSLTFFFKENPYEREREANVMLTVTNYPIETSFTLMQEAR